MPACSIQQSLDEATKRLSAAKNLNPRLDARVLLQHLLGMTHTELLLSASGPLDPGQASAFRCLVDRRLVGEPVAYLTGEKEFMGMSFRVGPGVLIPRPETELLVEWSVAWLGQRERPVTVIDVGTGCGAIALSVAQLTDADGLTIVGSDSSEVALSYAIQNRAQLELEQRVVLATGDLTTWMTEPADLIVANLPYLTPGQRADNPELADEPENALVGGPDGLTLIRRLVSDLPRVLAADGSVALEIDPSQAVAVLGLLQTSLPLHMVSVLPDLAGRDRVVVSTPV